jgi:predicted secreted protein
MQMARFTALMLGAFVFATASYAHEVEGRDRVGFQVESVREVQNDWAVARLTVLEEGRDAAVVSDTVNREMAAAVRRAKKEKGIEVVTGSYSTQPVYDNRRIVRWRAYQELRLMTADVEALSELVGDLQAMDVTLSGIDFSVAKETRRALEEELIAEALTAFQERAKAVAAAMGRKGWSLISLSIGQQGQRPPNIRFAQESKMASMSSAPATLEGGTSEVRIVVNGTIEIE